MNTYITSENIEEIKRRLDFLANNYDVKYKDVKIGVDSIEILFAEEKDYIIYPVEDFLLYTNNIQSLKGVNESTVRTDSIRQSVINLKHARLFIDVFSDIHYTVLLVESPLLIGLLNNVEKCTEDERLCSPCSSFSAIEIRYDSPEYVLPEEQESDIINRVLYYLIDKYNFSRQPFCSQGEIYDQIRFDKGFNPNTSNSNSFFTSLFAYSGFIF